MKRALIWAPLVVFLVLVALAAAGLFGRNERTVPSRLVGKPMPALALPPIIAGRPGIAASDTGPRLVNIFASWCVPCAAEVGQLEQLRQRGVAIDGIAVRDTPEALGAFLAKYGNPYRAIGSDAESRSMIALGSSGVPESFVVDGDGVIRHQHIGAIGPQDVDQILRVYGSAR